MIAKIMSLSIKGALEIHHLLHSNQDTQSVIALYRKKVRLPSQKLGRLGITQTYDLQHEMCLIKYQRFKIQRHRLGRLIPRLRCHGK
jgi:hypothetical protein